MHKSSKGSDNSSFFAEGVKGWKWAFSKMKKKNDTEEPKQETTQTDQ